jgi:hypothetical protein
LLAARVVLVVLLASTVAAGCTDKLSFLSSASLDKPAFDVTPSEGNADTTFHFDTGSWADGYNVTWEFSDGKTAFGRVVDHVFGYTNGVVTVTLVATDGAGKQGILTRSIKLGTGVNAQPRVTVSTPRTWVEVAKPFDVTARASDADKDPIEYLWTMRNITGSDPQERILGTGPTVPLAFDAPGKYVVKVRVRDPKGGEASDDETFDVSKRIPEPTLDLKWNGTLIAGTGGQQQASEPLWATPAPDTSVDAARHSYSLDYPASTVIILTWNDTSTQGAWDLDLELRDADTNKTIFTSAHHANPGPPPTGTAPFEYNFTMQPPGHYVVLVRAVAGAKIEYALFVRASLLLTPELVAATEK